MQVKSYVHGDHERLDARSRMLSEKGRLVGHFDVERVMFLGRDGNVLSTVARGKS